MIKKIYIIFLLLSTSIYNAQTAEEILNNVQKKFDSIVRFNANFIEVKSGLKGTFNFEKENKFKIITDEQIIASNDSIIWNYNKTYEVAIKYC